MVFIFLAYFTLYNGLQFHPSHFVYCYSTEIHALGFDELLESIFCLLQVVEAFSLQNIVGILEEVVVI